MDKVLIKVEDYYDDDDSKSRTSSMVSVIGKNNEYWTNERHSSFLTWLESSFVQTMFYLGSDLDFDLDSDSDSDSDSSEMQNKLGTEARFDEPPLDRYVPDISESTLDLHVANHPPDHDKFLCSTVAPCDSLNEKRKSSKVYVHVPDPIP